MKTILVIYTNVAKGNKTKDVRYSFNTESEVSIGDMIKSNNYTTAMEVVKVLDKSYKYFNRITGEMTDEFTNTNQYEIKELKIVNEDDKDIVVAVKIN